MFDDCYEMIEKIEKRENACPSKEGTDFCCNLNRYIEIYRFFVDYFCVVTLFLL